MIITILLACILSSQTTNAQRPTFMGFSLGGQTSFLIQKLRERGYDKSDDAIGDLPSEHMYVYSGGTFAGYDARVYFEEWSGFVKLIMATIECYKRETIAKSAFKKIKQRVIEKYGDYSIIADNDDFFSINQQIDNENFSIIVSCKEADKYAVSIIYTVRNMPNYGDDDI